MPNGKLDWRTWLHKFGWPELSEKQYLDKLNVLLTRMVDAGKFGKDVEKAEAEADRIYAQASDRLTWEGIHPGLPYFTEIVAPTVTPEWLAGRRAADLEQAKTAAIQGAKEFAKLQGGQEPMRRLTPQEWQTFQIPSSEQETVLQKIARQAEEFEQSRQQAMGTLGRDYDWITRWETEHTVNPFAAERVSYQLMTPWQRAEFLRSGGTGEMKAGKDLTETQKMLIAGFTSIPAFEEAQRLAERTGELMEGPFPVQWQESPLTARPISPGGHTVAELAAGAHQPGEPPPRTPPAPEWLARIVPGLRTGKPISPQKVPTPSGQLWGGLAPSQREQLAGFIDWTRREQPKLPSAEDVLWEMGRMLPRPSKQSRWAVIRR